MPATVVSFVVPALADDEMIIIRVPAARRRSPGFARRLAAFLDQDAAPSSRLERRNDLIRSLAVHYTGSRKEKARVLLAAVTAYQATRWRFDRRCAGCPDELLGTPQELMWRVLKEALRFPGLRQLQNILSVH